jgi:acylphosphatase
LFLHNHFLLQEINGRLASLSGVRGFRNYVQRRLTAIGVSGYIQRIAHKDADLVVQGTYHQIQQVQEFLEEIRGTLIESSFEINQPPKYLPTGRRFEIKKSDQNVHTGKYSDAGFDKLSVSSRSDTPILNSPDTHSDKGGG